jgi:hypothetical protein
MKIVYYKVKGGMYLASSEVGYSSRVILPIKDHQYNGNELQTTHHKAWFYLPITELTSVQKKVYPPKKLVGFTLIDSDIKSDKIPEFLPIDSVKQEYNNDMEEYVWTEPAYANLKGLYKYEYEEQESYIESVEFTAECLGELTLEKAECSVSDSYSVQVDSTWRSKGIKQIDLSSVATWSELEQMLTPEFLLYTRPCSLTSKQSYEIVRQYVKENIDPKQAVVTSDYNFCFTVQKKIAIKPYAHKSEIKKANGKSYAKPKVTSKTVERKSVQIFGMTNDEDKYSGYTVVQGFKGDSLEDLAENVRLYLEELMSHINTPVKQCECCNGTGHIIN